MTQLPLFAADVVPPEVADLGGLLAAHGQMAAGPRGARISILLADSWRADALRGEFAARGISAEVLPASGERDAILLRSERSDRLRPLTERWTRGAVKAAPTDLVVEAGMLRIWVLAAGEPSSQGYLLGLDSHAPGSHAPLAAALARVGLRGSVVGVHSGWPAVRLVGARRAARVAEMIGPPPEGAAQGSWPASGP